MSKVKTSAKIVDVDHSHSPIITIRFQPDHPLPFQAGQFMSVHVPAKDANGEGAWRPYSFSKSYEVSKVENHYEFCVKLLPGGKGSTYLDSLKPGDSIVLRGPYGEFVFHERRGRPVVWIGTSTGTAPLRAMMESHAFQKSSVPFSLSLFGFRHESEIPYAPHAMTKPEAGQTTIYAISKPNLNSGEKSQFFSGRVTDALRNLNLRFPWQECDFYICGNPDMIREVVSILSSKQVLPSNIFFESFGMTNTHSEKHAA